MKKLGLVIAALVGLVSPAFAQPWEEHERGEHREHWREHHHWRPFHHHEYDWRRRHPVVVTPAQPRCRVVRETEHDDILDTNDWVEHEVCD